MSRGSVSPGKIIRFQGFEPAPVTDLLVTEEPLEIRLSYGRPPNRHQKSLSVTMRTPGHDFELALGFLFSEGIIEGMEAVQEIRYCLEVKDPAETGNVVLVYLKPEIEFDWSKLDRHFYTSSSCGVCGKTSIESVGTNCPILPAATAPWLAPDLIYSLNDVARSAQKVFQHTGGIHAATLFDKAGELLVQREDVGRHNAVDKVIGARMNGLAAEGAVLMVSGRAGFELVQKTLMAGIPVMAAVGAPSSLAVELAQQFGLTLIGFLRAQRFNVYAGADRILMP